MLIRPALSHAVLYGRGVSRRPPRIAANYAVCLRKRRGARELSERARRRANQASPPGWPAVAGSRRVRSHRGLMCRASVWAGATAGVACSSCESDATLPHDASCVRMSRSVPCRLPRQFQTVIRPSHEVRHGRLHPSTLCRRLTGRCGCRHLVPFVLPAARAGTRAVVKTTSRTSLSILIALLRSRTSRAQQSPGPHRCVTAVPGEEALDPHGGTPTPRRHPRSDHPAKAHTDRTQA